MTSAAIRLVVNADDFGVRADVDAGILEAGAHGLVTSTTALVTGPAFGADAKKLAASGLGAGVHLALSGDLPTAADPRDVRSLLDEKSGKLPQKWPMAARRWALGTLSADEVRKEWTAQLARAFDAGLALDHVDSHEHVHAFPGLWDLAVEVAASFGIRKVRRPVEPAFVCGPGGGQVKRAAIAFAMRVSEARFAGAVSTTRHCHGIAATGVLDVTSLNAIAEALVPGDHELCCHPGRWDGRAPDSGPMDAAWLAGRGAELEALCDPDVRGAFEARNVRRVRFADL